MKNAHRKTTFDEALMKEDGSPIADSAAAHRILSGCVDSLDKGDMMTVAQMMVRQELLTDSEYEEIKASMEDAEPSKKDDDDAIGASDAAINRGKWRKLLDAGHIGQDEYQRAIVGCLPPPGKSSPSQRAALLKTFPHNNRLK